MCQPKVPPPRAVSGRPTQGLLGDLSRGGFDSGGVGAGEQTPFESRGGGGGTRGRRGEGDGRE